MINVIFVVIVVNMFFVIMFGANKCSLVVKKIWNRVEKKRRNKYEVEMELDK